MPPTAPRPYVVIFKAYIELLLHHLWKAHQLNGIDGAHFLPNNILFFCCLCFFDQPGKCCRFILDWISCDCYCYTSFNLVFILRESRVAHFVCFSFSSFLLRFVSGFSTHSAHAMLRTPTTSCCEVLCLDRTPSDCLLCFQCGFSPARSFGYFLPCAF